MHLRLDCLHAPKQTKVQRRDREEDPAVRMPQIGKQCVLQPPGKVPCLDNVSGVRRGRADNEWAAHKKTDEARNRESSAMAV